MQARDDLHLIRQARQGSTEALNLLFGRYGNKLLALIRLRLGPSLRQRLESQDVLQQTMLKAYEKLEQFDGAGEISLMAWLGAIARNEIRDQAKFHRRDGRDAARDLPIEFAAAEVIEPLRTEISRLHLMAQAKVLEEAIESLEESHREVLLLRRFEELSFPQISEYLGRSPDACRMLYSRAMSALTFKVQDVSAEQGMSAR